MKRVLALCSATAMSLGVASPDVVANPKSPKAKSNGWYVFDGVGSVSRVPKDGTYTRCVNDASTPPVIGLGARYSILNRSAPNGTRHILNGPGGIHFSDRVPTTRPGAYFHRFPASSVHRASLPPGTYRYKIKVGKKQLTTVSIRLVDDPNC